MARKLKAALPPDKAAKTRLHHQIAMGGLPKKPDIGISSPPRKGK